MPIVTCILSYLMVHPSAGASGFEFADFYSAGSSLNLVGDAALTSGRLRLAPGVGSKCGGAWFKEAESVAAGFDTTFGFQLSGAADGFALVIQNSHPSTLGQLDGGYMGYGIANSLAIEFDTWPNPDLLGDPNNNHIGIMTNGTGINGADHRLYGIGLASNLPVDLNNGATHSARIRYSAGHMDVLLDGQRVLTTAVDLASSLELEGGQAYVGFTAATGGYAQDHDILNWSFQSSPLPIPYTPVSVSSTTELPNVAYQDRSTAATSDKPDRLIVFDRLGGWTRGGTVDSSKPTIVLSHGYSGDFTQWPKDVADALVREEVDANIVAWDWEDDASPLTHGGAGLLVDLPLAGMRALDQGKFLGQRLLTELGSEYSQPIHFIGHSLGTRVNKTAADYVHSSLDPSNTQMTILDAAESSYIEQDIPWSNPIPKDDVRYIDNYISAFGALHTEAVNVQLFVDQLSLDVITFHGLPHEWYVNTIGNMEATPVGHSSSFDGGGIDDAPPAGTSYRQLQDFGEADPYQKLAVVLESPAEALVRQELRDLLLVPEVTIVSTAHWSVEGIRAVGDVTAGIVEDIIGGKIVESLSLALVSASPAYAWATIDVPLGAEFVTFDVLATGLDDDDFFAFGVNDTLILSLDQLHLEDGELTNVGLLDVSQWAGSTVDFFYGLETTEAGREISIQNFIFMTAVPEPSSCVLLLTGLSVIAWVRRRTCCLSTMFRGE